MSQMADPYEKFQLKNAASPSTAAAPRQAILVLGMHRSGTSALAGVAHALGAAAPKTPPDPDRWNERGYFESALFFSLLDELLAAAGSRWDDWRPLDPTWLRSATAEIYRQKLAALVIAEFGDAPLIVIKDPRICRLVPLVSAVVAELGFRAVAILPLRNPLEVAQSLQRRDQFAVSKSLLLWLRHVLDAEFDSRGLRRYFLSYEGLLTNWRYYMDCAAEKIGVTWRDSSRDAATRIDEFLALDLRHEKAAPDDIDNRADVPALVRDTHRIFGEILSAGENQALLDRLDEVRREFNDRCESLGAAAPAEDVPSGGAAG
jgi:hypothetical protein